MAIESVELLQDGVFQQVLAVRVNAGSAVLQQLVLALARIAVDQKIDVDHDEEGAGSGPTVVGNPVLIHGVPNDPTKLY
jgi:hypothetical protein